MSLAFKPISILSGLLAGVIGKKIFELIWGLIDEQDPPEPKYRRVHIGKLAVALLLEGGDLPAAAGAGGARRPPRLLSPGRRVARRGKSPTKGELMAVTDQLARVTPYLGRLLQDEYVQELRAALTGLRDSSRRAKRQKTSDALKDRRLSRELRDVAESLTGAARALGQPAPPERHLLQRALLLTAVAGGAAFAWRQRARAQLGPS